MIYFPSVLRFLFLLSWTQSCRDVVENALLKTINHRDNDRPITRGGRQNIQVLIGLRAFDGVRTAERNEKQRKNR